MDTLSCIASNIGIPLYADECTTSMQQISYTRVLIQVDVTIMLSELVKMLDPQDKEFTQGVRYDWKPIYYGTCL